MTLIELISRPDVVAAALLVVIPAAAGVNLYVTLGSLGLASRLGLVQALPPGLTGLENSLVIGTAALLLLVEIAADREHAFAGMWHTLHAVVKPLAAALLAVSALAGQAPGAIAAAGAVAAASALMFHAIRYGARVAVRMPDAPRGGARVTLAETALALALLVPVRFTTAAAPTAAGLILVAAIAGPLGVRAFRLGLAAQRARLRSFLGQAGWSDLGALPRSLRRLVPPTPLGGTPPRAARIGILRAAPLGRFSRGWLVSDVRGSRLLGRTLRGAGGLRLPESPEVVIRPGTWADAVEIGGAAGKVGILLLKDGPVPALVARAIAAEPVPGRRVSSSNA